MIIQNSNSINNSQWGQVSINYAEIKWIFPFHPPTGHVYNIDPLNLVRLKSAALTVGTPFVSIARCVYSLAQAAFAALANFYCYLDGKPLSRSVEVNAQESIRALKYGVSLTKAACLGIFFPEENRMEYGHLERKLNRQTKAERGKYYLAICFQPLAILPPDPSQENLAEVEKKLTKYASKIHAIRAKVYSWDMANLARPKHKPKII